MRTIAVVNQKGGCGKTTVSINLASALAEAGRRILLVDMDPQSHCAVGLAVPEQQIEQSIYDVLISRSRNEPIKLTEILWQITDKLELAPASIDLAAFEQQMAGIVERERCLRDALSEVKDDYDYVIVDCPPAVSLLTFNALRAASDVIVPVETGYFALHGLSKQLETLSILCKRCSQHVDVRVLASMYDIRTKMAREILAELREHFAERMFQTIVNFNTKIKEAASFGQPICEYDPASKGQKDFCALAEEVLGSQASQQRREFVNSLASQLESISATADELLQTAKSPAMAVKTPTIEQPGPTLNADELTPAPPQAEELAPVPPQAEELAPVPPQAEEPTPVPPQAGEHEVHEPAGEPEEPQPADTSAKLSDYYGVNQVSDAVVFVTLYPRAHAVHIAGDFNSWQPMQTPMEKVGQSGVWQTKLTLPQGKYRYRLVVDGQWQQDPYNEWTETNPFGELNSIIEVK